MLPLFSRITVFSLLLNLLLLFPLSLSLSAQNINYPLINDCSFPESVSLCNEPIPLENRRVWEMLDREFTVSVWNRVQVILWLKRAGRYFPFIERKLAEANMPLDLKYLAVAESNLLPTIRSRKGAVGTWQFIAKTARLNGLRVDRTIDERRSLQHSTEGAIKYLKSLKDMFGTWTLALAAYNCGEAVLEKEIEEQRVRDYYRLNLPLETERFIFRIAAIKIIMENPERYGYKVTPEHIYRSISYDTVPVTVNTSLLLKDIAKALNMDFKAFKEMNLHLLDNHLPKGSHTIYVPSNFVPKMAEILSRLSSNASPSKKTDSDRYVIVQPGDTLSGFAERTGVPVATLKNLNDIQGSAIRVGQKIKIAP